MRLSYSRHRHHAMTALALVVGAISAAVLAPSSAFGSVSPLTDPHKIEQLAAHAYMWGLPAEFVYRFGNYSTLVTAPRNTLGGGKAAAAWNNNGTNAGDASVLYLNAMIDLSGAKGRSGTKELVLTVPPSRRNYYVANLLDDFINTVASIGTRTTPSTHAQTYLLASPTSRYAHKRIARIHGFTYRVVPYDTNLGWILIRIRADTLLPEADRASALNPEERSGALRHEHTRPIRGSPTSAQLLQAKPVHTNAAAARAGKEVAERPDARGRILQADGRIAKTQPAPRRDDRAQRHPAAVAADLDRPPVPCHPALPQPILPPTANAGPVQAARAQRERLQDTEQLGPPPGNSPPDRIRRRAGESQPRHVNGRWPNRPRISGAT